ncbi:MAG: tRNA (N(6)-L-threonylcarbamoyladenosine(37)-C(2))-methylthiotransferase MtaB [Clostridia bacterium]
MAKIEEIDLVLGNNEKNNIVNIAEEYYNGKNKTKAQVTDIDKQKEFLDFGTVTYTEKTRASIKVQDGCNNFCSYCLIPYARGRVRSRKRESILEEIEQIAQKGIKEVVITGIHIASYGKDFEEKYELIDLLEDINKIDGIRRIRLGSLEPNIITEEFVNRLSKLEKICNHFHLSLQSGCNETLKRMNRKYTVEQIEDSVNLLRKKFDNVGLTADIIVGFPGETEKEFESTYNFLEKIKLTKMHVFKYSPREGTRAAVMPSQIDGNIKEQRSQKLIELSNKNEEEFLKAQIGKDLEVLFEEQEGEYWKGHTSNYLVVKKEGKNLDNILKTVNIIDQKEMQLIS